MSDERLEGYRRKRVCPVCGTRFTRQRSTKLYCSANCRLRAFRGRKNREDETLRP